MDWLGVFPYLACGARVCRSSFDAQAPSSIHRRTGLYDIDIGSDLLH